MCSRRSRCALAGALLLAATNVLVLPSRAQAQGAYTNNLVSTVDQMVDLMAHAAQRGRPSDDIMNLRNALDSLLNVLEQPRRDHGADHWRHDDNGRHEEHRSHLWDGLAHFHHDHHGDHHDGMDRADRKNHETKVQNAAQSIGADAGKSATGPKQARAKNTTGGSLGRNTPTTTAAAQAFDMGHAKHGPAVLAGAAEARQAPTLAPATNQANQLGQFKQGAGPDAGNVQAKNGSGRKTNNLAMNAAVNNGQANNQAVGGPAANPNGQQGNSNMPGWAKAGHHHHHHHDAGEARDGGGNNQGNPGRQGGNNAGGNGNNQANTGQQSANMGMCKQGNGPTNNQGRAKTGNGSSTAGNVAKNATNRGNANGQAANRSAPNTNTSATQAYVNQLMNTNGNRTAPQNQRTTTNAAQRSQGAVTPTMQQQTRLSNQTTRPTSQQHANATMMRSMQAQWAMAHAHQQAGMSVGQRFGTQSTAYRRR